MEPKKSVVIPPIATPNPTVAAASKFPNEVKELGDRIA